LHKCPLCLKTFTRKNILKNHKKIHKNINLNLKSEKIVENTEKDLEDSIIQTNYTNFNNTISNLPFSIFEQFNLNENSFSNLNFSLNFNLFQNTNSNNLYFPPINNNYIHNMNDFQNMSNLFNLFKFFASYNINN
jgi:hypothetical protein